MDSYLILAVVFVDGASEVRPDEAGSLGSPKVVGLFPTKPSIHPYFIRH
jgi:hypothetical protein